MLFPLRPIAKPRMTRSDQWRRGSDVRKCVRKYRDYKKQIQMYAQAQHYELPDSFTVVFGIPFPKSYNETKRNKLLGQPHQIKPDVDNLIKGLMDCLKSYDQSVWHVDARKVWTAGAGFIDVQENDYEVDSVE